MRMALRIAGLFAVYSGLAFVGSYAVGLLAGETPPQEVVESPAPEASVEIEDDARQVVVDVRPAITNRIRVAHSADCDFTLDRELNLSAAGLSLVEIHAGAGELRVEGDDASSDVVVVGRVCASDEDFLDDLTVTAETVDGRAVIDTHYPAQRGWGGSRTARIDLVVLVPTGMAVDIEDSSGSMEVSGTGALRIDDSSGGISVMDIRGSLEIDDSSGGLDVRDVRGDVRIEDSSGSIDIRSVAGSVRLRDGSGGIDVSDVEADVVVESDGSGSIEVSQVGRDFSVLRDGSGSIRHSGVRGVVDIPRGR